jgi:hypothetical protein
MAGQQGLGAEEGMGHADLRNADATVWPQATPIS